jgi:hypothetical protein
MKTAYATIKGIGDECTPQRPGFSAFYYGDPLGEMRR